MKRLRLHRYTSTGKVEQGLPGETPMELRPMGSVRGEVVDHGTLRVHDELPIGGPELRGILRSRDDPTGTLGGTLQVEDPVDSRFRDFTGLAPDTAYSLSTRPIATDGRVGPATTTTARTSVAPLTALIVDDGDGTGTHSYSNGNADPIWFIENSGVSITRGGGLVRNDHEHNFRMWTKQRVGGPGNNVRLRYRLRATRIHGDDATSIVEGVKILLKWVAPINPDQGPAGARGIYPWAHPDTGQNMSPGSKQYFVQTYNGYHEISKRFWGSNTYRFPTNRKDAIRPVGAWMDVDVTLEWLTNPTALRVSTYLDGKLDFQWTDTGDTSEPGGQVFNWGVYPGLRADRTFFELDSFSVETMT